MYRVAAPAGAHGVADLPRTLSPRRCTCRASLALPRVFVCAVRSCVAQTAPIQRIHKPMPCPVMLSYIYMSAHMLCRAVLKNISLNIIFLVDSTLANGYDEVSTNFGKGSEP